MTPMISRAKRLTAPVFILLLALTAAAQDASRVLQLTVGYNTLKNSTTLTAEKRAELEALEQKAREANAAGRYGEAMKHLYHGMAVIRGEEWTPWRALGAALALKVSPAVLEPGQTVRLEMVQLFAPDEKPEGKVTAAVSLLPLKDELPEKALKTLGALTPDWSAAPLVSDAKIPDVDDGNYRLAVTLNAEGSKPITKAAPVHIERGLAARVAALKARVEKVQARINGNGNGGPPASLPSIEYRIALYELAAASAVNLERVTSRRSFRMPKRSWARSKPAAIRLPRCAATSARPTAPRWTMPYSPTGSSCPRATTRRSRIRSSLLFMAWAAMKTATSTTMPAARSRRRRSAADTSWPAPRAANRLPCTWARPSRTCST